MVVADAGNNCTIDQDTVYVPMKHFWEFSKSRILDGDDDSITGNKRFFDSERDIWFQLVKQTCKKGRSVFGVNLRYVLNYIAKTYK